MSRTILVVVDPRASEPQPAVERAAWLAARAGASLELFACGYDSDVETGSVSKIWRSKPSAHDQLLQHHREQLERIAVPLRARGLEVTVDVAWDYPLGEAILRKATTLSPWLVAKDTFYNNLLQRAFLSNTDWELIRNCAAPLLLVKDRKISERPRVLVAVDPLNENDKPAALDDALFRFGETLARSTGGELHLAHVVTTPMGLELPPDATKLIVYEHGVAMTAFLETHPVAAANVHTMQGLPHECLPKAAAEQAADFVVMGAVARRGIRKVFIGSTAERMLDRVPCDLVILKSARSQAAQQGD